MSTDLPTSCIPREDAAHGEGLIGSVHSWYLVRPPGNPACELVLKLAGCLLRCRNCPVPDSRDHSGGQNRSLAEIVSGLWLCHDLLVRTGGGLTVTGGDPFAQPRFTAEILRHAREAELHTTVETPGLLGALIPDTVLQQVDRHVIDLPSTDPALYRYLTGGPVQPALAFAERLSGLRLDTTVRFLVIPGVTDSQENIAALALFVVQLTHRPQVEVVGFRHLGLDAYHRLNSRHPLEQVPDATTGQVARALRLFTEHGCPAAPALCIPSLEPPD